MIKSILAGSIFLVLAVQSAHSQAFSCGDPPSLTPLGQSAESVKGQLQGQANALSKLVGTGQLSGAIEIAKSKIYNEPGAFYAAQKDAYLSYIFCSIISSEKNLSAIDKIKALEIYKTSSAGPKKPVDDGDQTQITTTTCIKNSDSLPSGACKSFSDWYSLCSEYQPADWKIASSNFQLTGDRSCGKWAECNKTLENEKRVCHQFRMMGHDEECGRASNTGIKFSSGNLQITWIHPRNSKGNNIGSGCTTN